YRHLMQDVLSLLPHAKKDSKVESKQSKGNALNELLELRSCSSCLFFECRKQKDLYLWMVKSPGGPSVKFLVNAVHTMEELKLTGNHLKGSRPLLTFSTNFDEQPHWKLVKEMITQIFATPKDHRKAKPFHDHVFVFSIVDGHVWFRNYQISVPHNEIDKVDKGGLDKMTLIETQHLYGSHGALFNKESSCIPLFWTNYASWYTTLWAKNENIYLLFGWCLFEDALAYHFVVEVLKCLIFTTYLDNSSFEDGDDINSYGHEQIRLTDAYMN
ncbi:hypothetical protein ACJX0J_020757, partial [Zea mays]